MSSRKDQLREAKQRERLRMSEEKKEELRQAARLRMAARRATMTLEEKEERRAKDRERNAKKSQVMKPQKVSSEESKEDKKIYNEKDSNMMYKRKIRENQSKEERELRKIENVIQVRKHRAARTDDKIDMDKRKAKEGMKTMREIGKLPTHCYDVSKYTADVQRKKRQKDENHLWKTYCQENPNQKKLFQTLKPEAAAKLEIKEQEDKQNAKLQEEKRLAEEEEKESNGYWHYVPDCDDYMWVGSGLALDCSNANEAGMLDNPWNQTEEQLAEQKKLDDEYYESCLEWDLKEKREENAAKLKERREKNTESVKRHREKVKAKLQVPVEIPDYEKSEYELIRQRNIEEIEKMKKAIGLFDN